MRRTEPTPEENERLEALNVRLKPIGFTAAFETLSKKGSERPFRLIRTRSYLRYFTSIDEIEGWIGRVFDAYESVTKLNVLMKMFDVDYEGEVRWHGNKPQFYLRYTKRQSNLSNKTYYTLEGFETACHALIRKQQAKDAAE